MYDLEKQSVVLEKLEFWKIFETAFVEDFDDSVELLAKCLGELKVRKRLLYQMLQKLDKILL